MVNHPHITQHLMAARERDMLAAAARARLVRALPAPDRRLRLRLFLARAARRSPAGRPGCAQAVTEV